MTYLWCAFQPEDNCDDVETQGFVVDAVLFEEMICGSDHSFSFVVVYGGLGLCEIFVAAGLDLDKNDCPAGVCYDKVYFAHRAGVISGDCFAAL